MYQDQCYNCSISASMWRWHQWFLCPMTRGPCLLRNIWSFASTATSTPGGPMQSPVDTPSTKTTTSTSHTTKWWLPLGRAAYSLILPYHHVKQNLFCICEITMNNIYNVILFSTVCWATILCKELQKKRASLSQHKPVVTQRCNQFIVGIMLPLLRSVFSPCWYSTISGWFIVSQTATVVQFLLTLSFP